MTVDECVKLLEERGVKDGHLDGVVHDVASEIASAVNNCGLTEQVDFLCEHNMTPQEVVQAAFGQRPSDDEILSSSFAEDRERLLGPPKGRIVDDASALDVEDSEGPKSVCECGHNGDGPLSCHSSFVAGVGGEEDEGHGACTVPGCECAQFRWKRFR